MPDTIFALSSGAPPAAIAVVRVSGPAAGDALLALCGKLPVPRTATLSTLRDANGEELDRAIVLWFPGPRTATGEDLAELHLHGGRAVVAAVQAALSSQADLRRAEAGEFTRRAFANGRIDLAEAEGLADLLTAETELQRRQAMALAGGSLSKQVAQWRDRVLAASAAVEAVLDFGDEDDVAAVPLDVQTALETLLGEIGTMLEQPRAEVLKEGFRVVLAGPPNSGKSSLFNCLVDDEAAITAPIAGTTRDVLTRSVALSGIPFQFVDTAGLREVASDPVEAIGVERAKGELQRADLILWLGEYDQAQGEGPVWEIDSFADSDRRPKIEARHRVSAVTGQGVAALREDLVAMASLAMPKPGVAALNDRQGELLNIARGALEDGMATKDLLLIAETLRGARVAFDRLLGRAATEDMLDALFGRFCIGK